MSSNLLQILQDCQNPDFRIRSTAEQNLITIEKESGSNLYLKEIFNILSSESSPLGTRQLAGVILKNSLVNRKDLKKDKIAHRVWIEQIDQNLKNTIKQVSLKISLSPESPEPIRQISSQIVSAIAIIEFKSGCDWPEFRQEFENQNVHKINLLNVIGILSEDVKILFNRDTSIESIESILPTQFISSIFEFVLPPISHISSPEDIKSGYPLLMATIKSLLHGIGLVSALSKDKANVICGIIVNFLKISSELWATEVVELLCAGYEVLIQFFIDNFDMIDLGQISNCLTESVSLWKNALLNQSSSFESISSLGLVIFELWSTTIEEEENILDQTNYSTQSRISFQMCPVICPLLIQSLLTASFELLPADGNSIEESEWDLRMSAASTLSLLARVVKDDIVDLVLPKVTLYLTSSSLAPEIPSGTLNSHLWKQKDAGLLIFSSILDGPSDSRLSPIISSFFLHIAPMLTDESLIVRDSAAWTISSIVTHHPMLIEQDVQNLIQFIIPQLRDHVKVARHICDALATLADLLQPEALSTSIVNELISSILSASLGTTDGEIQTTIENLGFITSPSIIPGGYFAISRFIAKCPPNNFQSIALPLLEKLFMIFNKYVVKINSIIENETTRSSISIREVEKFIEYISIFMDPIVHIVRIVDENILSTKSEAFKLIFTMSLHDLPIMMNKWRNSVGNLQSFIPEETLVVSSAFVLRGSKILKNNPNSPFPQMILNEIPFLLNIVSSAVQGVNDAPTVALLGVLLIGDIARINQDTIFTNEQKQSVLSVFHNIIVNSDDNKVKIAILECISDLACTSEQVNFLSDCLKVIFQASIISPNENDEIDWIDYCLKLHSVISESLSSIIHTDLGSTKLSLEIGGIIQFLSIFINSFQRVYIPKEKSLDQNDILRGIIALFNFCGDVINAFRNNLSQVNDFKSICLELGNWQYAMNLRQSDASLDEAVSWMEKTCKKFLLVN